MCDDVSIEEKKLDGDVSSIHWWNVAKASLGSFHVIVLDKIIKSHFGFGKLRRPEVGEEKGLDQRDHVPVLNSVEARVVVLIFEL